MTLGRGSVGLPAGCPALRLHVPALPRWLGPETLRRTLARETGYEDVRTIIFQAWSPAAAAWWHTAATSHRPLLIEADADDDLETLAGWSRSAAVFIVCADRTTQVRLGRLGVPATRAAVVRPAVDPAALEPSIRSAVREELGLLDGQRAILVLPPITRGAGSFLAVWAVLLLEKVRPDIRLIVPAGGREAERIGRLVDACRHNEVARFASPGWSLSHLLAAADLAVYAPPSNAPSTGLAQSMAAGCPIVATAVPCVTELLTDGESAWLCRPAGPEEIARRMLAALENPERSRSLAERARMAARELFSETKMIAAYARIYLNLETRRPIGADEPYAAAVRPRALPVT
jgi:glycosyltransferase involved in cell wall biosynthesis